MEPRSEERRARPGGRQPRLTDARIEGERVCLRPLTVHDADVAFALIHGRREILEWLVWPGPQRVDDLLPVFTHWAAYGGDGDNYHLAIVDRATDLFAGSIGVRFACHPGDGQLGYWLATERWGRGWMSEAVGLIAHLCFEHLAAERLYACVFAGNEASRRVLEKNGFVDVSGTGTVPPVEGGRAQWAFALSHDEWFAGGNHVRPQVERVRIAGREES